MSSTPLKKPAALSPETQPETGRLRVTVVTETWPPEVNGVAMTIHQLVSWLGARHDVTLVRVRQGRTDRGVPIPGVRTELMPGVPVPRYHGLRMGLLSVGRLKAAWSEIRPDVVHVITEGPLGWSAVRAATALGIPVISDFHTNFHQYTAHYGFGLFRRAALNYLRGLHNRTRVTLVPTQALADDLGRSGFRDLDVLARGIDTELFSPERRNPGLREVWGASPDDPVLLMVSRIAPEKNLPLALAAFARAREQVSNARMVVVGDGPARAGLAGSHPEVHFAGMQTGVPLAEHYASADIFVFPSLSETFGNVTLEAMASGLAVAAFDYAAAREHIVHGQNGLALDPDDTEGFIAAVAALTAQPDEVSRLASAARTTALDIDWSNVCLRYEMLLRKSLEAP